LPESQFVAHITFTQPAPSTQVPQTIDLTANKLIAFEERMRAMEGEDLY